MKNPIRKIRNQLEDISCTCAEGPEFMNKLEITDEIQKRVLLCIAICDSVLQPADAVGLIKDIRHKQVLAGEQAVCENLKKLGFN